MKVGTFRTVNWRLVAALALTFYIFYTAGWWQERIPALFSHPRIIHD